MADYKFKVSTEEVRAKAQQIENQRLLMEGIMADLQTKINSLEEYWRSDSGTNYAQVYQNLSRNISASLNMMQKHVSNLNTAAAHYSEVETEQVQKTNALSTQGLF